MRAAGLGDVATYGEALVRHVVDHLLHICGEFGFAGARLPEGLGVILRDDEALHATLLRVFDADADGVVTASDLATTLSLARSFFNVSHVDLEAKFEDALVSARAPVARAGGAERGMTRETVAAIVPRHPVLDAWTRRPVTRVAQWLARRARAMAPEEHAPLDEPPPAPPPLRPPPGRRSRREEAEANRGERRLGPPDFTMTAAAPGPREGTTGSPSSPTAPPPAREDPIPEPEPEPEPSAASGGPSARVVPGWAARFAAQFDEKIRGDDSLGADRADPPEDEDGGILKPTDRPSPVASATSGASARSSRLRRASSVVWEDDARSDSARSDSVRSDVGDGSGDPRKTSDPPREGSGSPSPAAADAAAPSVRGFGSDASNLGERASRASRASSRARRASPSPGRARLRRCETASVENVAASRLGKLERLMRDLGDADEDSRLTREQVIEMKMRREIEEKQMAALAGKAHEKEWDYAAYEHRRKRIFASLEGARWVDVERRAREQFLEEQEKGKTLNKG
jgi:hypothetical protein